MTVTKAKQKAGTARLRRSASRRGASLVEVLVVLVILLIGVASVIRVFPAGFAGLRVAENRTLASRLATQLMDQIKADETNLPLGVLTRVLRFDPQTNAYVFTYDTSIDPDDMGMYDPNPDDNDVPPYNPYFADVNKFRYIDGERVKIPLPSSTAYGTGSLYTVKFGPVYMNEAVGDPERVPNNDEILAFNSFLRIYGAPLRGIPAGMEDGYGQWGRLRGPQTYLIDYDDGQIMFFPRRPRPNRSVPQRVFQITVSYEAADGSSVAVGPIDIIVPDSDTPQWQPIGYQNLYDGSDVVNRVFTRLAASNPDWDPDDPYEYKLLSANIEVAPDAPLPDPARRVFANMGVLAFNPAGANYSERTPFGQRAFAAFVDYSVLDWHILREDREVPSVFANPDGAIPLKLTLGYIKRVGDPEPDQTIYQGLYRNPNASVDIQVFDLQGSIPGILPGQALRGAPYDRDNLDRTAHYWVDEDERGGTYRTGTIYINQERVPRGAQLRTLYKAEGDWAVSIQKAYATYERAFKRDGDNLILLTRPTKFDNYGQEGTRLYFNRTDLNKSVVATLQYQRTNGDVVRTQPVQFTVDQLSPPEPEGGDSNRSVQYAYVDVARYMPGRDTSVGWRLPGRAAGVSLKVRVIWKDNTSPTSNWRIQDMDTYITPNTGS